MRGLTFLYKRPAYVSREEFRRNRESWQAGSRASSVRSRVSQLPSGIPDAISFEKVVKNQACPPLTLPDFMNYLLYIEHSAENLQFFLWYEDYCKRFKAAPASDLALAPEWTRAMEDEVATKLQMEATETVRQPRVRDDSEHVSIIFKGTDFEKRRFDTLTTEEGTPFSTPPPSPGYQTAERDSVYAPSSHPSVTTLRTPVHNAFIAAGAKMPFTIQPFREEISRIISAYLMDGASRQINLSDRDRRAVMHALSYTTHPSALRIAFHEVDSLLRFQSHPNFVRWSLANVNPIRVSSARVVGFSGILLACIAAFVLTLSDVRRGWRALAAIGWVLGVWILTASFKGMCIYMYAFSRHHQHIRPWELFEDPDGECGAAQRNASFESFGTGNNSFENEPWVEQYADRSFVSKIFERHKWIQEPAVRRIHDIIFFQAMAAGFLSGGILTALFVLVPAGNFF